LAAYLVGFLKRLGFTVRRQSVRSGRANLIGCLKGREVRRRVLLEAHMDTVGVEGMTVPPFRLTRKGSRLYGRGTSDTKGPMAAYLAGLARALRDGVRPAWTVLFVATMGEETGCEGAAALAQSGFRATAGVVAEPTRLNLCVAHKGAVWWKASVKGRTTHGSSPHLGVNAIDGAAAAIQALLRGASKLPRKKKHPLISPPTVSVGTIRGGEKDNVVPASAEFTVDSRLLPGEGIKGYLKRAESLLRSAQGCSGKRVDARVVSWQSLPAFCSDPRAPFLRTLFQIAREVAGNSAGKPVGASHA
jgi:acetylornithine deacetylase